MESNITDQQYFGTDLHLAEPHFDEEATLLSARPVVPLRDVRAETRSGSAETGSGRRLAFGLAMVVAVLAGAIGAGLIYKQRAQKQATAIVNTGTPVPEPAVPEGQLLSGAGGAISDSTASPVPEKVDVTTRAVAKEATTETRKSAPPLSSQSGRAKEPLQDEASDEWDHRESRRAERMEARRLRREAKREGRDDRIRQPSDDLLRIREIFEGSRRP
jgi:hypothetical protein